MRAVAIVPARSGSSRIPEKNVVDLQGHPMMAYTIAAGRKSGCFDSVVVSTDSERYARIASHYGAEVVRRPAELAGPEPSVVTAVLHALGELDPDGSRYDVVAMLMACCPLRRAQSIRDHVRAFVDGTRTFQISLTEYVSVYPEWAMVRAGDGRLAHRFGTAFTGTRSQDLGLSHCPTGALWLARSSALRAQGTFYGEPLHGEVLPFPEGMDIDEPRDLEITRALCLGLERLRGVPQLERPEEASWQDDPKVWR